MINVILVAVIVKFCLEALTEGTVVFMGTVLFLYSVWHSRAVRTSFVITLTSEVPGY